MAMVESVFGPATASETIDREDSIRMMVTVILGSGVRRLNHQAARLGHRDRNNGPLPA